MTCSNECWKAASRVHRREEARRLEEEARQQRLAHWQGFQPTTQHCLEQVVAVDGETLAEQLAEAIRSERERPIVTDDQESPVERGTLRACGERWGRYYEL